MEFLTVLNWLIWIVVLFSASILIHEYFHFLVAVLVKLRVDRFSIGFGPRVWGVRRKGTDFRISLIPFGGYVSIPQMEAKDDGPIEVDGEVLPPAPPLAKIATAAAGAVGNILFALFLACLVWWLGKPMDQADLTDRVGFVAEEAEAQGVALGDRIVEVNGKPVKNWRQVRQMVQFEPSDTFHFVFEREGRGERYEAIFEVPREEHTGLRILPVEGESVPVVDSVQAGSPAEEGGMLPGDEILEFNGRKVLSRQQFSQWIEQSRDREIVVTVLRPDPEGGEPKRIDLRLVPRMESSMQRVMIGIAFGEKRVIGHPTPLEQFREIVAMTVKTIRALFTRGSGIGAKHLSGPVGILYFLQQMAEEDYRLALWFTVLLNINLGVLNLLPIPVLDGGHILFSVVEMIRGRPLPARFVQATQTAFAVAFIAFFLFVTWWDGVRIRDRIRAGREFKSGTEEIQERPFEPVDGNAEADPAPAVP